MQNHGKYAALFGVLLRAADVLAVTVAGLIAWQLRFGALAVDTHFMLAITRALLLVLIVMGTSSIYRSWRGRSIAGELLQLLLLWTAVFAISVAYILAMKLPVPPSRLLWGSWFVLAVVGSGSVRIAARAAAGWLRRQGWDSRTAVIVGDAPQGRQVSQAFEQHDWAGITLLGRFCVTDCAQSQNESTHLGDIHALAGFVEEHGVDQVWVTVPLSEQAVIRDVLDQLSQSTAEIKYVPDLFGMQLLNHSVEQVAGIPVVNLRRSAMQGNARLIKALEDRVLALLILVLISPLLLALAIAVKVTSPGPVLFRQLRHGRNGRPIEVWKFRSMRVHEEGEGVVTQATRGDSRVTPLGRFMRRTSLDELPQFFNVLQGTMSIVGPRPHAMAHNQQYRAVIDQYMQRHRVKPGITGWAQINGLRGETDTLDKMERRVQYDMHYLQNWSVLFDLRIIVTTMFKGFIGKTAY